MKIKSKSDQNYKCPCGIKAGACKNLSHPRLFSEYLANSYEKYIERWALSKYTIHKNEVSKINPLEGHTILGQLISDYKYTRKKYINTDFSQKFVDMSDDEVQIMQNKCISEIYRFLDYFLTKYFPKEIREFDCILPIPPSSKKQRTIPFDLSEILENAGFMNGRESIQVTNESVTAGKNLHDYKEKKDSAKRKLILGDTSVLRKARGVLVLDDVYETGATASQVLELVNSVAPDIPKYFLSISFVLRDVIAPGGKL